MISRSNCANESRILSVSRPMEVLVLKSCVTETKLTPRLSNSDNKRVKSSKDRLSRSLDFGQKSQAAAAKARDFQASLKPRGARTLLFSIISWRRRARRSRQEGRSAVRRHLGKAR